MARRLPVPPTMMLVLLAGLALAACQPDSAQDADAGEGAGTAPVEARSEDERPPARAEAGSIPHGKGFDFYVLALSWSPSYCAAEGAEADRQQCASGRRYGFVVHGLWPQFERGFPRDCPTGERDVPREALRTLYDIMPSAGLIRYQWRTHGACAGLPQRDYFAVLREARSRVAIPADLARGGRRGGIDPDAAEAAFLAANPGLPRDGVAVVCDRRYLREVRICMTRDLAFRSCPQVDRRACSRDHVVMPAAGGG